MRVDLTYHPDLYLGESIRGKKLEQIQKRLEERPLCAGVFLLTLSRNPKDLLEIYEAGQLAQRYYKSHPPYVVGIAGNYREAVGLVEKLTQECLRERGDCALKEYLLCGT